MEEYGEYKKYCTVTFFDKFHCLLELFSDRGYEQTVPTSGSEKPTITVQKDSNHSFTDNYMSAVCSFQLVTDRWRRTAML
jgi:hypothetical protein